MIVDLPDTTTSKISKKIMSLREQGGVIALGRVLTLVVVTKSGQEEEAIEAGNEASREHPCRIIVLADAGVEYPDRRDARFGWVGTPNVGVIVLRGHGHMPTRANPWLRPCSCRTRRSWRGGRTAPRKAPVKPPSARSARRITDSANEPDPRLALENIRATYKAGDTDLAWTRLTNWRMQLALQWIMWIRHDYRDHCGRCFRFPQHPLAGKLAGPIAAGPVTSWLTRQVLASAGSG